MYLVMFLRHIGAPHFLSGNPFISLMNSQKSPKKEGQGSYPGNDANEDAPIGCFV